MEFFSRIGEFLNDDASRTNLIAHMHSLWWVCWSLFILRRWSRWQRRLKHWTGLPKSSKRSAKKPAAWHPLLFWTDAWGIGGILVGASYSPAWRESAALCQTWYEH